MTTDAFLDCLCEALNLDQGHIKLDDLSTTSDWWDSLAHMGIIATIDAELDLDTQDDEALFNFRSMRELIDHLRELGALEGCR